MEQGNFKKFKCEDGKEYIFNYKAFKMELKKAALIAKKTGFMSTIEDFKEGLAGAISVSVSAIKQWETGRICIACNDLQFEKYKNPEVLLPKFSCHTLRHTFTTRLVESGMNVAVVKEVLGHSDITTTLNIYTTVTKELQKSEFEKLKNMKRNVKKDS